MYKLEKISVQSTLTLIICNDILISAIIDLLGGKILKIMYRLLIFMLFLLIPFQALGAPEVEWRYFETEHFKIVYHPEVLDQANAVATIAESVLSDQARFTGFKLYRKIAIIVSGLDDFANGFAVPRDVMKVWVNPLYTSTRVDQDWLKNLVTHELTHIVQMEATFGVTYWTQKTLGGGSLLGVPPNAIQPGWFVEGVAQYGSTRQGFDQVDRKRQMVMEQRIQSDDFYTHAEILWNRGNIGGEGYYNFGFGFIEYLMRSYGERLLVELQEKHNSFYFLGLENTIRMVYNKSLSELLDEWKQELRTKYPVRTDRQVATMLTDTKPALSEWKEPLVTPKGDVIFAETNINRPTSAIRIWTPTEGVKTLMEKANLAFTRLALSPNGERFLYTAYHYKGSLIQYDLYEFDRKTKQSQRLTTDARVAQALYYKDGYLLLQNDNGRPQLAYLHRGTIEPLVRYDYNFAITDFAISPDQRSVAVNFNYNGKRGIGLLSTETWEFVNMYYPNEGLDWLLGEFVSNNEVTLSWERLSHYDLYRLNITTGVVERLTNTREDVMQGQLFQAHGETFWYGQIYGPTGFDLAKGSINSWETLTLQPALTAIVAAPKVEVKPLAKGKYDHFRQLRSDLLSPYFDSETKKVGYAQLLTDPLMELQVVYDLGWNFKEMRQEINVETAWTGSNPGLKMAIQNAGPVFLMNSVESYNLHPYYIQAAQTVSFAGIFRVHSLGAQLARTWETSQPGSTAVQGTYYLADSEHDAGYTLSLTHQQTAPIGYNGSTLASTTALSYAGGSVQLTWGGNENILWTHPKTHATAMAYEKLQYRQTFADISADFINLLQTGRVYVNLFGELGLFHDGQHMILADQIGAGLELETQILNMVPLNFTFDAAVNHQGNWNLRYGIASPF